MPFLKSWGKLPAQAGYLPLFCAPSIPERLISFHKQVLSKQTDLEYRVILLQETDIEEVFAQLAMTFLGQTFLYALKDGDISPSQRKKLDAFLKDYTGPHYLFFFTNEPQYQKTAMTLEYTLSLDAFKEVAQAGGYLVAPTFIENLFSLRSSYTLDQALMLLEYAHLLGSRHESFFSGWISRLIEDDVSLFTLSQYFFSQQKALFLKEWVRLKDRYPQEFWVTFFSEQLWQAVIYLQYIKQGKAAESKRYTYRLPFSFLQKDYKKYSLSQLAKAHELLSTIDYGMKNGYATQGIEVFIHTAL